MPEQPPQVRLGHRRAQLRAGVVERLERAPDSVAFEDAEREATGAIPLRRMGRTASPFCVRQWVTRS